MKNVSYNQTDKQEKTEQLCKELENDCMVDFDSRIYILSKN